MVARNINSTQRQKKHRSRQAGRQAGWKAGRRLGLSTAEGSPTQGPGAERVRVCKRGTYLCQPVEQCRLQHLPLACNNAGQCHLLNEGRCNRQLGSKVWLHHRADLGGVAVGDSGVFILPETQVVEKMQTQEASAEDFFLVLSPCAKGCGLWLAQLVT